MASATSPHLFCEASKENTAFIEESLAKHEYMFFIRKMSPDFPDAELNKYIYEYSLERDNQLIIVNWFLIKKMYHVLGYLSLMAFIYFIGIFLFY
jgi:hypothetical protein